MLSSLNSFMNSSLSFGSIIIRLCFVPYSKARAMIPLVFPSPMDQQRRLVFFRLILITSSFWKSQSQSIPSFLSRFSLALKSSGYIDLMPFCSFRQIHSPSFLIYCSNGVSCLSSQRFFFTIHVVTCGSSDTSRFAARRSLIVFVMKPELLRMYFLLNLTSDSFVYSLSPSFHCCPIPSRYCRTLSASSKFEDLMTRLDESGASATLTPARPQPGNGRSGSVTVICCAFLVCGLACCWKALSIRFRSSNASL